MAQSLCHLNWKFSKDSFVKKKKKKFCGIFSFLLAISLGIIKLLSIFPNQATIRITWETFKRFLDLLIDNL